MGKTAIWTISSVLLRLLTMLRNNEQNLCQAMLLVGNIVSGGEGGFETHFLKLSKHFVTDCLKFTKRKENGGLMHSVANNSNLLL